MFLEIFELELCWETRPYATGIVLQGILYIGKKAEKFVTGNFIF